MRGRNSHLTAVSRIPSVAQTALQLKLDAILVYMSNGIDIFNSLLVYGGGYLANTTQILSENLPYKNGTGGSTQGGGDTGTGGTDTGGGGGLF